MRAAGAALDALPPEGPAWYAAMAQLIEASRRVDRTAEVVRLAKTLPEAPGGGPPLAAWMAAASVAAFFLFEWGCYELARSLSARIDDGARGMSADDVEAAARVHRTRSYRAHYEGDVVTYLRECEEATRIDERAGNRRDAYRQAVGSGQGLLELGRYAEAERVLRRTSEDADRMGLPGVVLIVQNSLGVALAWLGRFEEARRVLTASVEAARSQGDRRLEGTCLGYLALIDELEGDFGAAEAHARAALATLEGAPLRRLVAATRLARALLGLGRLEQALEQARAAHAVLESLGSVDEGEALLRLTFAEALHAAGRAPEARAAIAEARGRLLARADRIDEPEYRASFLADVVENARTLALARAWLAGPP